MNGISLRYSKTGMKVPEIGFLRLAQVLELLPISRTAFYNGVREGRYPKPVKLSERTSAWKVEEIRGLISRLGGDL